MHSTYTCPVSTGLIYIYAEINQITLSQGDARDALREVIFIRPPPAPYMWYFLESRFYYVYIFILSCPFFKICILLYCCSVYTFWTVFWEILRQHVVSRRRSSSRQNIMFLTGNCFRYYNFILYSILILNIVYHMHLYPCSITLYLWFCILFFLATLMICARIPVISIIYVYLLRIVLGHRFDFGRILCKMRWVFPRSFPLQKSLRRGRSCVEKGSGVRTFFVVRDFFSLSSCW